MTGLDGREQRVVEAVAAGRDELVDLLSDLIGFDTTARVLGDPARDEAKLQQHLGERLGAAGAEVDIWEPAPGELPPGPQPVQREPRQAAMHPHRPSRRYTDRHSMR